MSDGMCGCVPIRERQELDVMKELINIHQALAAITVDNKDMQRLLVPKVLRLEKYIVIKIVELEKAIERVEERQKRDIADQWRVTEELMKKLNDLQGEVT